MLHWARLLVSLSLFPLHAVDLLSLLQWLCFSELTSAPWNAYSKFLVFHMLNVVGLIKHVLLLCWFWLPFLRATSFWFSGYSKFLIFHIAKCYRSNQACPIALLILAFFLSLLVSVFGFFQNLTAYESVSCTKWVKDVFLVLVALWLWIKVQWLR